MAKISNIGKTWATQFQQQNPYTTYTAVTVDPTRDIPEIKSTFANWGRAKSSAAAANEDKQLSSNEQTTSNPDIMEWDYSWTPVAKSSATGSVDFNTAFDEFMKNHSDVTTEDRNILTNIAEMESGFRNDAANSKSSALGWFLFLDKTRNALGNTDSREDFTKNTLAQLEAAYLNYKNHKKTLAGYLEAIKKYKLTPTLAMYGMWWRPASMIKYLKTGLDDYVNSSDLFTLEKALKRASKYT